MVEIICPSCLNPSGNTTDPYEYSESNMSDSYEQKFADKYSNGYVSGGFEVCCGECGCEFFVSAYYPEPQLDISEKIDSRTFLKMRGIKLPPWVKDSYDIRDMDHILTLLQKNKFSRNIFKLKGPWGKYGAKWSRKEKKIAEFLIKCHRKHVINYNNEEE